MSFPPQQPGPYGQQGYPGQGPYGPQQGYPGYQPGQAPGGTPQGLFGGTPYWAHYAYQQQQGHPPPQWGAPQRPRRKRVGLIVACVVLGAVLLAGAGIVTWFVASGDDIVAGDCIGTDEVAVDADVFEAECGSADSGFRVVEVVRGNGSEQCAGSFVEQEGDEALCTTFDVRTSDCLTTGGNPEAVPIKVGCGDPRAQLVVTTVKRTEPSKDVCAPEELPYGTSVPPLTLCLTVLRSS